MSHECFYFSISFSIAEHADTGASSVKSCMTRQGHSEEMDRVVGLVTQGCGFESRLRQEVHDCSPGVAQSAAHCSKCVHLDGLNAENTFHSSLYSV